MMSGFSKRTGMPSRATSLSSRLEIFRKNHSYREISTRGVRWRYLLCGQGERILLLPSGGTRVPDMYLLLFEALEPELRLVAPAYPPLPTMAALVDGMIDILNTERIEQVDLLGSSFGGFVAQCFVRGYPERVRDLILANTGVPGTSPLPGLSLLIKLFELLPEDLVRQATGWNWRRWFKAPKEERAFWLGLIDEILATQLTKADLVNALREMLDYATHYRFTSHDLALWPGRVLLIESEQDEAFSPAARRALRAVHPHAQVHTFGGAGHAVMVTAPQAYLRAVLTFLQAP
jgi:pimeloyl-ACP methyl ester carboxylesterase